MRYAPSFLPDSMETGACMLYLQILPVKIILKFVLLFQVEDDILPLFPEVISQRYGV